MTTTPETKPKYQVSFEKCKHCGKELSPQERLDCEQQNFLPTCADCMPIVRAKIAKLGEMFAGSGIKL